ncbi:diaminopimelate epimerase [Pseudoxanthomonas sacheonensis]|uniref:Diaminopimelate epimerase n=1 Tax=Pseudoxanthomonas sacheonensis TaxID=443615 RepID=A0ABU1RVB5_9GAMM|nr:diaminopimelate epimerase [Pseudoxanthomonas sacheonensis]MDR6842716.1 diaminopimelate epimerase [Pseudoxanthomonas sacheonensis]
MTDQAAPGTPVLRFSKMHGAGNDFVVIDLRNGTPPPDSALASQLADRHFGVGCDQILTIEKPRSAGAVASYRIWNSDGSTSQQCGNGARCVAAWLVRDGVAQGNRFRVDSPLATHDVERLPGDRYAIAMGVPEFDPAKIPLAGFASGQDGYEIALDGKAISFGAASMGNPHAVIEVQDIDAAPIATLGPALQSSAAFPQSANIGFAQVVARDRLRLRVFERGVGETLACGSGACAAAAVLMRRGKLDRAATVSLPGGDLQISWPDDAAEVIMSGPAAFVFEGEWKQ